MSPSTKNTHYDAIIIGAGASGMMCGLTAGYRGKRILIIDHAPKVGAKIRIAGGGKCNFTNRTVLPDNYHSQNQHFVKSALSRYSSAQFIEWIERHEIDYEERDHGQLFCTKEANDIITMLKTECAWAGVSIQLNCNIQHVAWQNNQYSIDTDFGLFSATKLVVATGGISYPKLKASPLGYRIAQQFGLAIIPPRPGLVGLKVTQEGWSDLAGIALPIGIRYQEHQWTRNLLFTHTGISGQVVLLISNVWQPNTPISLNLLPNRDVIAEVNAIKQNNKELKAWLRSQLPKRLADYYWQQFPLEGRTAELSNEVLANWATGLQHWQIIPSGTDGYHKAEVTVGGVDTHQISSKTMEASIQTGLYFIGEVLDVTGDLGGYNLQWAWASGFACGSNI